MTNKTIISASFTLLLITSCIYQFSEDRNFVPINKPVPPTVEINLQLVGKDTLKISNPVTLVYEITGVNIDLVETIFFRVGEDVKTISPIKLSGSYLFIPPYNTKGFFTLKLIVISKTESGSLAEKSGQEHFLFEKSWPLLLDTKVPGALHITSIRSHNGSLRIDWEKYKSFNFHYYGLVRTATPGVVLIHSADSNFYYNRTFISGSVTYAAGAGNSADPPSSSNFTLGPYFTFTDTLRPRLFSAQSLSNNVLKFTWTRGHYPANIKSFEVSEGENIFYGTSNAIIYSSTITTDTSFSIEGGLGIPRYFYLRSSPYTTPNNAGNDIITQSVYQFGEHITPYNVIRFSSSRNHYFTLTDNLLRAFRIHDRQQVGSSYPITPSSYFANLNMLEVNPTGDHVVHVFNRVAKVYSANTFALLSQFSMTNEIQSNDYVFSIAISHTNQLYVTRTRLIQVGGNLIGKPAIVIYDLASSGYVKTIENGPALYNGQFWFTGGQSRLSDDDQYIAYEPLLHDNNGAWGKIRNDSIVSTFTLGWPLFNPQNPELPLTATYGGNKVAEFNTNTQSFGTIFNTLSGTGPVDFLPERNLVVLSSGGRVYVFDYVNQQTLFSVKTTVGAITLEGDYLYCSSGNRVKIN